MIVLEKHRVQQLTKIAYDSHPLHKYINITITFKITLHGIEGTRFNFEISYDLT